VVRALFGVPEFRALDETNIRICAPGGQQVEEGVVGMAENGPLQKEKGGGGRKQKKQQQTMTEEEVVVERFWAFVDLLQVFLIIFLLRK
jgi:hypothetical protein